MATMANNESKTPDQEPPDAQPRVPKVGVPDNKIVGTTKEGSSEPTERDDHAESSDESQHPSTGGAR